jgi:hypothetical protein
MRNIATVIDEILAVIPKNPSTSRLRIGLNSIKNSVGYRPPESISHLWGRASELFWVEFEGLDPVDLTGWERTVVDIWMDKK